MYKTIKLFKNFILYFYTFINWKKNILNIKSLLRCITSSYSQFVKECFPRKRAPFSQVSVFLSHNPIVSTSKDVMQVSLFSHNIVANASKSAMQNSVLTWQHDCEHIKKCNLKFGLFSQNYCKHIKKFDASFCLFHNITMNTTKCVMQVSVFFHHILWTHQ